MPRIAYGNEAYFRQQYPDMPDERVYALLTVAAANPDVHKKEPKSMLIKKCGSLYRKTIMLEFHALGLLVR